MDQETEAMMGEIYRLFGRLRYALMETQGAMAQILGRGLDVDRQGKPDPDKDKGWTGIPRGWPGEVNSSRRDDECPVDDSIKARLPVRIP